MTYFFKDKEPIIVNIFEHRFTSNKDVSDRLYLTNKALFDKYLKVFTEYIKGLNTVLNLNDIAVHIEMRADGKTIIPIEINPLRFTGMCLNELFCKFVGEHPLSYFFTGEIPDYNAIWEGRENKTYYFSIIEKPEGIKNPILDIEKLKKQFSNILELRLINNPKLNILAHVFAEIDGNSEKELHNIATLDVKSILK
ncbi:MAG: ATP-grasp domain-containing protein [Bacteroidales bacterium]